MAIAKEIFGEETLSIKEQNHDAVTECMSTFLDWFGNLPIEDLQFPMVHPVPLTLHTDMAVLPCEAVITINVEESNISFKMEIEDQTAVGPPNVAIYRIHLAEKKSFLRKKPTGFYVADGTTPVIGVHPHFEGLGIGTGLFDSGLSFAKPFLRKLKAVIPMQKAEIVLKDQTSGKTNYWTERRLQEAGYIVTDGQAIQEIDLSEPQ